MTPALLLLEVLIVCALAAGIGAGYVAEALRTHIRRQ